MQLEIKWYKNYHKFLSINYTRNMHAGKNNFDTKSSGHFPIQNSSCHKKSAGKCHPPLRDKFPYTALKIINGLCLSNAMWFTWSNAGKM